MDFRIILLILSIIFAIFPILFFSVSKNAKHIKVVSLVLSILYILVICIGVFSNIQLGKDITIIPFDLTVKLNKSFDFNLISKNIQDFIINILMFIPLGFLLTPLFKTHTVLKTLLIGISFSILIEIMQLILPINRSPQLSDIVLNSLSCLIGIACFLLFRFIVAKLKSNKKTI